jgi:hypothetical protein
MKIAGEICIYTNDRITIEELYAEPRSESSKAESTKESQA